ncbi:MAG: chromate transporter [Kiritimatiellia bacterium]
MITAGGFIKEHDRVGLGQIFVSFMKIGAVLFGGGYAMLPLLEREVVGLRKWCRIEEMGDYYAMAQLVPGVVAVNTAMLIGHRLRGFWGTLAAMLGVVLVPFFVLLAYAIAFDSMSELAVLKDGMAGLRPAVAGLMVGVAWKMFNRSRETSLGLIVALGTAFLAVVIGVSAVYLIVGGVLLGILWFLAQYIGISKKTSSRLD